MPVILLLVFLQSLGLQEGWGPGDANSGPHPRCYPCGWSPHKTVSGAANALSITPCLLKGLIAWVFCSEHGTPHPPRSEIPRYFGSRSELTRLM